jgi:hypothetical protein
MNQALYAHMNNKRKMKKKIKNKKIINIDPFLIRLLILLLLLVFVYSNF